MLIPDVDLRLETFQGSSGEYRFFDPKSSTTVLTLRGYLASLCTDHGLNWTLEDSKSNENGPRWFRWVAKAEFLGKMTFTPTDATTSVERDCRFTITWTTGKQQISENQGIPPHQVTGVVDYDMWGTKVHADKGKSSRLNSFRVPQYNVATVLGERYPPSMTHMSYHAPEAEGKDTLLMDKRISPACKISLSLVPGAGHSEQTTLPCTIQYQLRGDTSAPAEQT